MSEAQSGNVLDRPNPWLTLAGISDLELRNRIARTHLRVATVWLLCVLSDRTLINRLAAYFGRHNRRRIEFDIAWEQVAPLLVDAEATLLVVQREIEDRS